MKLELDDFQLAVQEKATRPETPNVFVVWARMGTGKTRCALALFENSGFENCIVVTRRTAFQTWQDEIDECHLSYRIWENNYLIKNMVRPGRTKDKKVLFCSAGDLKNFPRKALEENTILIVDELYLFSNPDSQRSKALQAISIYCTNRVGLSGTLMPSRDNMSIFGQMKALQGHRVLARTKTDFRSKFQTPMRSAWGGREFLNKEGSVEEIKRILDPMCFVHFPEARPTRIQIVKVRKNPEQKKAIESLKTLFEWKGKEYKYALQIVHAVNAISNGWWKDEEAGTAEFSNCPKLDMLLSLIMDLEAQEQKVVIWCAYQMDVARISNALGGKCLLWTSDIEFNHKLWNEGEHNVVVATEGMGSSVNWFKDVKYVIYYSISPKLLELQQSMGRHERKGSAHHGAHYYFLQTQGTYDAQIYHGVTDSEAKEKQLILTLAKNLKDL